jgi:hypothetical protein
MANPFAPVGSCLTIEVLGARTLRSDVPLRGRSGRSSRRRCCIDMQSSRRFIGYDRAVNDARPRWINARRLADLHDLAALVEARRHSADAVVLRADGAAVHNIWPAIAYLTCGATRPCKS